VNSLSKLPPAIRHPLLGIFVLGCIAGALAFAGLVVWALSFPAIWIWNHITWQIIAAIVGIPIAYSTLAAIGRNVEK